MLAVESLTALVFGGNNPLNRCEVELAECVVLATEETSPTFKGASRIDPNLHDPPAYERLHPLGSVPSMKQQSCGQSGQNNVQESAKTAWSGI